MGFVLNLVSDKQSEAPKAAIRKHLMICLVTGYPILSEVFRYFSWPMAPFEWIQIILAFLLYLIIGLLVLIILFQGVKRLFKKQS
jgi:hypothetical protein